jgi:hypothetical protein
VGFSGEVVKGEDGSISGGTALIGYGSGAAVGKKYCRIKTDCLFGWV